ncbi:MMPL family transporter [Kitasatospora viridis]|uniref:RND superfamily putative drug exporter n=1 Tax=Kitasatospora viridis TaxID=281105 RepID=A0A561TSB8_9ACTN|nr:MMPL family transporter [Kitasatospora viridis]TWF90000.1 RND superfamily putative drug exporter [Kitasatospora viridis]
MSTYLFRLGRWAFRHRRAVLGAWLAVAVLAVALATASGGKTNDTFTIPGTESQRTTDLLKRTLPALAGGQTQVVFAVPAAMRVTEPGPRAGIDASLARIRTVPQVATVSDPYAANGVSPDGQVALVTVQWTGQPGEVKDSSLDALKQAVTPARSAGVQVEYSGSVYPGWRVVPSELPELIGLVVAFVILMITFGALVAAGMPILTAVLGVVVSLMGITALASVINIASASTTVAIMLGLSCGIDYGLFILFRHRNQVLQGMALDQSVGLAVGTAGGSVVFAALTVIIALSGMSVVGIPFLTVMGLSAAAAVAVALLIALTLLPALLGFAGEKITAFVSTGLRPGHHERVAKTSAAESPTTGGARWARFVVRHRVPAAATGVALLLVLAIPALSIQLGLPSGASKPTSDTQRRAYDLISTHFGPGYNGPLLLVTEGPATPAAVQRLTGALATQPDVAAASSLASNNQVAIVRLVPKSGPNDTATADLVHGLRDHRAALEAVVGAPVLIGGTTASNIDVSQKLADALPVFLAVVVGLAFVLLTLAFRTILVPIKSIIGFLLSVAAAFGAQVAMFQWGWGRHLFNIVPTETISFLPLIMLAIIFGLSSDYEVFVVSRIKEDFTATDDARGAVQRGTARAARVVTAAALIMFSIFVAFMFTSDPTIKAIGFSFAAGVFLDAFVVRLTVVPAVMAIVGARIWYHPRWFARYVPDPDLEGTRLEEQLRAADESA